ncbi:hypothetical protein LZ32DRAFT_205908 [Colletotrichum eremochloae]|nr:hypothetical protein LZ32DRAFT_205908 [Colletotrichum eremochloae]
MFALPQKIHTPMADVLGLPSRRPCPAVLSRTVLLLLLLLQIKSRRRWNLDDAAVQGQVGFRRGFGGMPPTCLQSSPGLQVGCTPRLKNRCNRKSTLLGNGGLSNGPDVAHEHTTHETSSHDTP